MTNVPRAVQNNSVNGGGSENGVSGPNSISNELASTINDGLYFYEQVEGRFSHFPSCQPFSYFLSLFFKNS